MSDTLAFLIDAPMQSWGASSKFQHRETESWPTKSALLGLIAAALGIDKHGADEKQLLAPYIALTFTILRWQKKFPSLRLTDFHTIGGGHDKADPFGKLSIPSKAGDSSPFGTVVTRRSYLTDSRFIALFQGEREILETVASALRDPVWGVWFGRKTCIPSSPLSPVVSPTPLNALHEIFTLLRISPEEASTLEGLTETPGPGTYHQADQPLAYGLHHGPIPEGYHSRPIRRLAPGELP